MGQLLSCALPNLENPPGTAGSASGTLTAAAKALADARCVFSGQPRARHTPEPAGTPLARSPRPAGARPLLYLVHDAVPGPERAAGDARGRPRAHAARGHAGGGARPRLLSNYSRAAGAPAGRGGSGRRRPRGVPPPGSTCAERGAGRRRSAGGRAAPRPRQKF